MHSSDKGWCVTGRSEHHKDAERFLAEGVPRNVFWWRQPVVFSALGLFAAVQILIFDLD